MSRNELWKELDLNPQYMISNSGRILNMRTGYEIPIDRGYKSIGIMIGERLYHTNPHRLVAYCFLGLDIFDSKIVVRHKDDNPLNNFVDNLELGTQKDNIQDCVKKGRRVYRNGNDNHATKIQEEDIESIFHMYHTELISQTAIGKKFGVGQDQISRILNGERRNTLSLKLKYRG